MDKIYYLASCDTCRKIIKSLPKNNNLVFHDIKQDPITIEELEKVAELAERAKLKSDYWNEDELKMYFVAPLLLMVNFEKGKIYRAFFQRRFKALRSFAESESFVQFLNFPIFKTFHSSMI